MSAAYYQIRVCQNCGLRYPLIEGHPFGERCPLCLGETVAVLERAIEREPIGDKNLFKKKNLRVMLDNIRSAWNVGSIFRSADGFEFRHAYLCGITPTPDNADVRKTALGAEQFVTWSAHKNVVELAVQLKKQGVEIWALELTQNSTPVNSVASAKQKSSEIVLAVGNEVTGVDPGLLELADRVVHLPMRGQKRSFNVAVAFAVAAQILRSRF
ncbi:MAG: TrmH family RNA methyltransferase [Chloroflexi bacterium]|nr:TrmH family RNA methyltransferase [Chloroflexota bacterium]